VFSNPIPYGGYVITNWFNPWHSGIDLAGSIGASIQAADTGKVIFAGWSNSGYGNLVVLAHGSTWMTYYAHLDSVSVGCGQIVSAGGEVGKMGTTGNSGGPHLHFEIRYHGTPDNPSIHITF
jgi:murein DD-endopeptidase MepM/ murein hydrolase activator NlpD